MGWSWFFMQAEKLQLLLVDDDESDYLLVERFLLEAFADEVNIVWANTF